jgi:hypothetical protein
LSRLGPLDLGYLDSGHSTRSCIRSALKLERWARRHSPDHDPNKGNWGFFAQRARRNADALTHHLFRFPRERASMLIIESSLARILAGRRDELEALSCCRAYLCNADAIIQTLDTDARIRMRFRLERSKVNLRLATVVGRVSDEADPPTVESEQQYLLMASNDARMLLAEANTHGLTLWTLLAKRQEEKIVQAQRELDRRRIQRQQEAAVESDDEPPASGAPGTPSGIRH